MASASSCVSAKLVRTTYKPSSAASAAMDSGFRRYDCASSQIALLILAGREVQRVRMPRFFDEILLVEQRELHRAGLHQRPHRRTPQRANPVQPRRLHASRMRASVNMPRSPTNTTLENPKRCLSLSTCAPTVAGSAVLPWNTSTATGRPSASHNSSLWVRPSWH